MIFVHKQTHLSNCSRPTLLLILILNAPTQDYCQTVVTPEKSSEVAGVKPMTSKSIESTTRPPLGPQNVGATK